MKKTIKLFTLLALFVFLTNCEKEDVVIDNTINNVQLEINTISIEEFQKDKSNDRIYDAISSSLDGKEDIKKKGGSNKITVLTEEIMSVNKNDTITYSFRVKKNTSKSSVFENIVIHKYPDGSHALGLVKFKPGKEKDEFPYRIKYKKIQEKKLENFTDLDNILKNSNSCFEKVYKVVCSDDKAEEHGNYEIGNTGVGCGGTYWVYNAENCLEDGGGIDHYPGDDDINDDVDYNNNSSAGGGSGQTGGTSVVNIPPCGDSRHGCDVVARGLARQLNLNTAQTDWLVDNYTLINNFLDNKGDTPETREEAKLTIEVESEKNKFDYSKKGTVRDRPSLKYKAKATISNGTSYLLETGEQVFESPSVRKINRSAAIFQTSQDDAPYYYIYYPGTDRWYDLAIDNVATDCLSCDLTYVMTKASLDALKFTGRYIVPFEDIKIIIDGKDFEGLEANRSVAFSMILISVVPGGKLLKAVPKIVKGNKAWQIATKIGNKAVIKTADEVFAALKTEKNKAFFWSGRLNDGVTSVMHKAREIASNKGGTTLEGLLDLKSINLPKFSADTKEIWEQVSKEYANKASGEVKVVLGSNFNPNGIWNKVEFPALKSNLNVTKIIKIDPDTLIETILFLR